jgi:hypothetical protein
MKPAAMARVIEAAERAVTSKSSKSGKSNTATLKIDPRAIELLAPPPGVVAGVCWRMLAYAGVC